MGDEDLTNHYNYDSSQCPFALLEPKVEVVTYSSPLWEPKVEVFVDSFPLLEPKVEMFVDSFPLLEPKVEVLTDSEDDQLEFNDVCCWPVAFAGQHIKSETVDVDKAIYLEPQNSPATSTSLGLVVPKPQFHSYVKVEPAVARRCSQISKPKFQGYVGKGTCTVPKLPAKSKSTITETKKIIDECLTGNLGQITKPKFQGYVGKGACTVPKLPAKSKSTITETKKIIDECLARSSGQSTKPKFQGYVRKGARPTPRLPTKPAITGTGKNLDKRLTKSSGKRLAAKSFNKSPEKMISDKRLDKVPETSLSKSLPSRLCKILNERAQLRKQKNKKESRVVVSSRERESVLKCDDCRFRTSDKREYQFHRAKHDPNVTVSTCDTCSQKFLTEGALNLHQLTHIVSDMDAKRSLPCYTCHICEPGKSYVHKSYLKSHLRKIHQAEMLPNEVYRFEDNLKFFC